MVVGGDLDGVSRIAFPPLACCTLEHSVGSQIPEPIHILEGRGILAAEAAASAATAAAAAAAGAAAATAVVATTAEAAAFWCSGWQ